MGLANKDGMSFEDYIKNPSGKGASAVTNKKMYEQQYKSKFDAILLREQGNIKHEVYTTRKGEYYFHIYTPDEVIPNFYFNVVIYLSTKEPKKQAGATLRNYEVKFYSNDPAFMFTFAYAFKVNDLLINDLKPKISKMALTTPAKVRNPDNEVFYVKSLYFAYLTMVKYNLFDRRTAERMATPYNKALLLSKIERSDIKLESRKVAEEEWKKKKKEDGKTSSSKPIRNKDISTPKSNISKTASVSKTTKISPTINTVKKTRVTSMKKR